MNQKILFFFLIITTKSITEWDYKQHGKDWEANFKGCKAQQKSPMNILSSKSSQMESKYFFFPKIYKNRTGKLQLMEQDNLLVLNYTNDNLLGELMFKIKVDFLNIEDGEFVNVKCHGISFKFPGEFTLNKKNYDGELQVNCSTYFNNQLNGIYIVIPFSIVNDTINQSHIFDEIYNNILDKNLPIDIYINDFKDFLDDYTIMDEVYFYQGMLNFPPCDVLSFWFFVSRDLYIHNKVYDKLKGFLNKEKCPDGNNRLASEQDDSTFLYNY